MLNTECRHYKYPVIAIYTDDRHKTVHHYRCPNCGATDNRPFGREIVDFNGRIMKNPPMGVG